MKNRLIFRELNVNPLFYHFFVKADAFKVKDTCTGCNQCAKKCPMNNVQLIDGKPVWGKNCTSCLACYHVCPQQAVQYGKRTRNKGQYFNPDKSIRL